MRRSIRTPRFGRLRTKLAVLYTGLFALALALLGVTAQALIRAHAQASTRAELVASGTVYDGLWALRSKTLGDTAEVLARDFGFRTAVATGDRATIVSALATLRDRAGVRLAMVVDMDGKVIGAPPVLAAVVARVASDLQPGRHDAVVVAGNAIYRVVVSPIMAPTRIGSVVFALPLDGAEMRSLQDLSAIPLTATDAPPRRRGPLDQHRRIGHRRRRGSMRSSARRMGSARWRCSISPAAVLSRSPSR